MFERFTERARYVVVLAQTEARALKHGYIGTEHLLLGLLREEGLAARVLGHNYIGTEHLLLGLVRANGSVGSRILLELGADAERVRTEVLRVLSGPGRRRERFVEGAPASQPRPHVGPRFRQWIQWPSMLTGAALLGVGLAVGRAIWG